MIDDGAFDTRRCHTAIVDLGGTAVIHIRRNGRLWKEGCPAARARNEILRATRRFGRANRKQLVRLSRPKSDRGKNALPQILRRADRLARPGQTDR
ncbi:hypothetical protein [Paracoccus beibuensis]|uniref:hypothetical protein n=1 Tax=Paracoccus beibuensis TaxID=547602 RepID=UPI003899439E